SKKATEWMKAVKKGEVEVVLKEVEGLPEEYEPYKDQLLAQIKLSAGRAAEVQANIGAILKKPVKASTATRIHIARMLVNASEVDLANDLLTSVINDELELEE